MQKDWQILIILLLCGVFLGFYGITNHAFWDDEANTALFARNFLLTGKLTAWDGKNLVGYREGIGLDENLNNVYMPQLQFIVAAAGLSSFDNKTLGGRTPFVIAGIFALIALALWVNKHFNTRVPVYLPVLIAVLSPTYLLFIRQCRYYSLRVLFTFMLFAAWAWCDSPMRVKVPAYMVGAISTVGLWFTNYLNAAAALALLPVFFADHQYRNKKNCLFLILVYLVTLICGVYIYLWREPFSIVPEDSTSRLYRYLFLLILHLGGLGIFEFIPILLLPVLLLPNNIKRIHGLRPLARSGLTLVYAIIVYILAIVLFSPQHSNGLPADMRYVVPVILLGVATTSIIYIILWNLSRWISIFVAILTIFTNTFTLSYLSNIPWRSSLLSYLYECQNDYKTSTESVIEFLSSLPPNRVVLILPSFMAYSPMFYQPELNYCCHLRENKIITPDLRSELPIYIFTERAQPDYILSMLIPRRN